MVQIVSSSSIDGRQKWYSGPDSRDTEKGLQEVASASSKVLVTGGCGFIGRFAVADLINAGFGVTVVDNLATSSVDAIPARCPLHRADPSDQRALSALMKAGEFDYVLHLAGPHSVPDSRRHPEVYRAQIVGDTQRLLTAVAGTSVRGILFPSTSRVYAGIWPETKGEDAICNPVDPYGQAKLAAERLLQETAPRQGLKLGILRLFNVAGAHPRGLMGRDFRADGHMVKSLCSVATGRKKFYELHAYGLPTRDGSAIRDYVHVQDVARAFRMTIEALDGGAENLLFNVGTGTGTTVLEMIRLAERVFERKIAMVRSSSSTEDIAALVANIERIEHALGWSPRYGVRDILEHAWLWERTAPASAAVAAADAPARRPDATL